MRDLASSPRQRGGAAGGGDDRGGGVDTQEGPLRGEGFVQWSDRLRSVEEMLDNPELRQNAAEIREAARSVRVEFKRHSQDPQWDIVKSKISAPLAELRNRIVEELARRGSREALVPIDRDPVPPNMSSRCSVTTSNWGAASANSPW